jgi:hypothetical protein
MPPSQIQKLHCYVDETGQDVSSHVFIVVAVVSSKERHALSDTLCEIEEQAETGHRKWHKTRSSPRLCYLNLALERSAGHGEVFFGSYPKPVQFFLPIIEVIESAISAAARVPYGARVLVDGIDRKKAGELTNALRARGVSLEMVRGARDESEPIIRLADMWAGCIRGASLGRPLEDELFNRAIEKGYLRNTKEKAP